MMEAPREQKLANAGRYLRFDSLRNLDLSDNKFTGDFPLTLTVCTTLEWLDLSKNLLGGTLPNDLSKLSLLKFLNLANNKFEGPFPKVRTWTKMQSLNLGMNALKGKLPGKDDMGRMDKLALLNIAHNNLSGQIPESLSKCESLKVL